ncbi:MAG TPA: hypothetical protein VFI31_25350 [Pirellulales bacterium]|nr:hypothetical protein [Pirellulales bacterium]
MSATLTAEPIPASLARAGTVGPTVRRTLALLWAPLLVTVAATALAALAYTRFLETARHLWGSGIHDHNAHYLLGLSFALDFRHFDLLHFIRDLHAARVWAPLHALLVGVVLSIGGPDYRLAVLPNLAGLAGTALFAFLTARRAVVRGGNLAGLTAALFVLASPAHRAFATDIMLESLGACFSLAAVYAYLVVVQERSVASGRALGLALTLLFFQKYNYWLLVVLALLVAAWLSDPRAWYRMAVNLLRRVSGRAWWREQLRHPLTYVLLPMSALLAFCYLHGGTMQVAGHRVNFDSPYNLVHVAFALSLLRVLPWWLQSGRQWVNRFQPPLPQLIAWHLYPIFAWFLWPQRLGYFLWYLLRDHGQEQAPEGLASGPAYYWQHLGVDYHLGQTSLIVATGLAAAALVSWRRLRPGGIAVLCLLVVAAALTFHHPTHRSRFVHSWIAAGWVAAGIGLAQIIYSGVAMRRSLVRPLLGAAALGGLVCLQFPDVLRANDAPEGGTHPHFPSVLGVTDAYLPSLDGCSRPAIFANLPIKFLTGWTLLERRGRHLEMVNELRDFGASPEASRRSFDGWLKSTSCDAIVLVEIPPGSTFYEVVPYPDYGVIRERLTPDSGFSLALDHQLSPYGCRVTVWRR